ncbi:MAG TPA: PQQ-dependent sugar dehydrogenase [Verrucomicrobiae bacterium]|nr:PQQ-dependent sugar dehydrogenase [Verrucomicrobiae bacterium]
MKTPFPNPPLSRSPLIAAIAAFFAIASFQLASASEAGAVSNIGLRLVAEGFSAPIGLAAIPGGKGSLLVADQRGLIYHIDGDGKKAGQPFLDLREKITAVGQGMEERGLLGLALHPKFKSNRKFYVVYSAPRRASAPAEWDHTERLSEFKTRGDGFATADPGSERVLLDIDEPDWNHNSGRIAFGPDGYLYWTVGDGGAFNDVGDVARGRGHPPEGNGQKLDTFLGKVLRLDVDHGTPYGIPKDNPFVKSKHGFPEIFAYGFRNPWGISFDRGGKHDLIVADVGQDRWEEINVVVNGGNYGWRLREGFEGFDPKDPLHAPTNSATAGADGKPFVDPVFTYKTLRGRGTDPESYGVTVTGGYVYRGKAFPALRGKYIFADWSRSMALPDGTLLAATIPNKSRGRWTVQPLGLKDFPNGRIKSFIWALGEDDEGELYVLANGINSAANGRGKVFKLVPQ